MNKTKKTFYRKNTASLPKEKNLLLGFYEKYIEPALTMENFKRRGISFGILFLVLLFIFSVIQGIFMYVNYRNIEQAHGEAEKNLTYWEKVLADHPTSPDVYYNAAIYAGMLGEREKAIKYLKISTVLDPDFEEAKVLEKKLSE